MLSGAAIASILVATITGICGLGSGFLAGRKKANADETLESLSKGNRYLADRLRESQTEAEEWRQKFWDLEAAKTGAATFLGQMAQETKAKS